MSNVLTFLPQGLISYAGIGTRYKTLPIVLISTNAREICTISRQSTEPSIDYARVGFWIQFIVKFMREWTDVDWIPTFDMVMVDNDADEPASPYQKWVGACSARS